MHLKPDALLQGGKYKIIKFLGQGGFGITYLAEQTMLDRHVCIKEFFVKGFCDRDETTSAVLLGTTSNAAQMRQYMAKFIKEAKTIGRLEHPNIVRIIEIFEENNTAYIVMEYISGESLAEYVRRVGAIPLEEAVRYVRGVGSALAFAHAHHVMHLDVKPSNVMLDQEKGRVVLIDFGLSKQYSESGEQTSSTPVGISHGYAPMEQYLAGGVQTFSPATDIYSLGAMLYKLVTGQTPPPASMVFEDGLPDMGDRIPASVRQAIESAMKPSRKDRPQSVEAFLALLDQPAEEPAVNVAPVIPAHPSVPVTPVVSQLKVSPPPATEETVLNKPVNRKKTETKPSEKKKFDFSPKTVQLPKSLRVVSLVAAILMGVVFLLSVGWCFNYNLRGSGTVYWSIYYTGLVFPLLWIVFYAFLIKFLPRKSATRISVWISLSTFIPYLLGVVFFHDLVLALLSYPFYLIASLFFSVPLFLLAFCFAPRSVNRRLFLAIAIISLVWPVLLIITDEEPSLHFQLAVYGYDDNNMFAPYRLLNLLYRIFLVIIKYVPSIVFFSLFSKQKTLTVK